MEKIIYEVHSDCDEDNLFRCFEGRGSKQAAVAYAKRNKEGMTWVDKVIINPEDDSYEYCGAVWNYSDKD